MSWSWWCRSKCCELPWGKKHIKQRCWWRNPTCGCDKASPSLSFAFHSVCEHYPRCTCVIKWTHIELYDHLLSIWGRGGCTISVAVTKRRHHFLLLAFLVALSPVYLRVEVNTQSTLFRVKPMCLMSSSFGCDGNSWSNAMISPLCFEFVSYVFLISGLNILFLAHPYLVSILFQHIIIPEVSVQECRICGSTAARHFLFKDKKWWQVAYGGWQVAVRK